MRSLSVGIVLLGFVAGVAAQSEPAVSQLTYEVSIDRVSLLPLEPVLLTLSVANRTDTAIPYRLALALDTGTTTMLVQQPGGKVVEFDLRSGYFVSPTTVLRPGDIRMAQERLFGFLDAFFPTIGTYQVAFRTADTHTGESLTSRPLMLRLAQPEGANREAYEYLRQSPRPGSWFEVATRAELEYFLARFPTTRYADYARLALGQLELGDRGDPQRAIELFAVVARRGEYLRLSRRATVLLDEAIAKAAEVAARTGRALPRPTFQASTDQRTLLPLEPVLLTLSAANRTNRPIPYRLIMAFDSATTMLVRQPGGKVVEFDQLSSLRCQCSIFTTVLDPGETRTVEERLGEFLDEFFPTAGTYQVTFRVFDYLSRAPLSSNVLVLRVVEPTGVDRDAYVYLRQSPEAGSWFEVADRAELEDFLARFSTTRYADYARLALGQLYLDDRRDYQRAIQLFAIVAGKGPSRLSERATALLEEAQAKAAQKERR